MKAVSLVLFIFSIQLIFSQDFKTVDSIVNTYPKNIKTIQDLTKSISEDFKTDINKTRAVFFWIGNNVTYDYKALRKKTKFKKIKSRSKSDYEEKLYTINTKLAEKTIRKKTAVCEGYAQLLKSSLEQLGITSVVVTGYAKRFPSEIGRKLNNSNHAWNAVKIKNQWHLMDVTWSTGNSVYNEKFFDFSDTYFMIPPKMLILSHFPEDTHWQLLNTTISKEYYFNSPIIHEAYHNSGLTLSKITNGTIFTKTDSIIKLKFKKIDNQKKYYYAFDDSGKSGILSFVFYEGNYITTIPYQEKRRRNLVITDGHLALIKFKIKLQR